MTRRASVTKIVIEGVDIYLGAGVATTPRLSIDAPDMGRSIKQWLAAENLRAPCRLPGYWRFTLERIADKPPHEYGPYEVDTAPCEPT